MRLWFFILFIEVSEGSFKYLGCCTDMENDVRDLNGLSTTFRNFKVPTCIHLCRSKGYPYAGAEMGKVCMCGLKYGLQGPSINCNTSCDRAYCGGYKSNDIYYTIDSTIVKQRKMIYHAEKRNFLEARKSCVYGDGDLSSPYEQSKRDLIVAAVENATDPADFESLELWIGLRKRFTDQMYEWTNSYLIPFDSYKYRAWWSPKDERKGDCVVMHMASRLWRSVSCSSAYPSICFQISDNTLHNFTDTYTLANKSETGEAQGTPDQPSTLVFYIVVPLFAACYGGSCIAFCTYKIYINCFTLKRIVKKAIPEPSESSRRGSLLYDTIADFEDENLLIPPRKPSILSSPKMYEDNQQHKYFGAISTHALKPDNKLSDLFFANKNNKIAPENLSRGNPLAFPNDINPVRPSVPSFSDQQRVNSGGRNLNVYSTAPENNQRNSFRNAKNFSTQKSPAPSGGYPNQDAYKAHNEFDQVMMKRQAEKNRLKKFMQ